MSYLRDTFVPSKKLQKQINEYKSNAFTAGEQILVKGEYLKHNASKDKNYLNAVKIKEVKESSVIVFNGYHKGDTCEVPIEYCNKDEMYVGANPFPSKRWDEDIRTYNFSLIGILLRFFDCNEWTEIGQDGQYHVLKELNWNPFVINKDGEKEYYQRDFCWTKKQKQLLIESIYNGLNCGQIIVRRRDEKYIKSQFAQGNYEAAFHDIVDGKQRLNAVWEFINNKFPDLHGNYFNDLSKYARHLFEESSSFVLSEIREGATDKDVIRIFLNVNFTGVPMSKSHIDFVKEINNNL